MWFVLFAFQVLEICLIATTKTCFMLLFHDLVVATCHSWGRFATSACVQSVMFSVSKTMWASVSPVGNDEEMSAALLGWFGCFGWEFLPPSRWFLCWRLEKYTRCGCNSRFVMWKVMMFSLQAQVCYDLLQCRSTLLFFFLATLCSLMQGRVHSMSSRRKNQRQIMTQLSKTSLGVINNCFYKLYTIPWWLITMTMRNFSMPHDIQKLLVPKACGFRSSDSPRGRAQLDAGCVDRFNG